MSVTMYGYQNQTPNETAGVIEMLMQDGTVCPVCQRVAKWYYRFYEPTSPQDSPVRCTMHPMSPIPGPADMPDRRKVMQYY